MPHKHKRKRDDDDEKSYNVDPEVRITSLTTARRADDKRASANSRDAPPWSKRSQDDTPKAFARMMAFKPNRKRPSALDDGTVPKSKRRKGAVPSSADRSSGKAPMRSSRGDVNKDGGMAPPEVIHDQQPKILPHERLSDFAQRVDQTMPLSFPKHATTQKSSSDAPGLKVRTTKHNRKLLRMQNEWRETEKRRKEQIDEGDSHQDEKRAEERLLWASVKAAEHQRKGKRKGHDFVDESDPWAVLEKRRKETKQMNLQDVVQAPPKLAGISVSKIKLKPARAA